MDGYVLIERGASRLQQTASLLVPHETATRAAVRMSIGFFLVSSSICAWAPARVQIQGHTGFIAVGFSSSCGSDNIDDNQKQKYCAPAARLSRASDNSSCGYDDKKKNTCGAPAEID